MDDIYKVNNLGLATYLKISGVEFKGVSPLDNNRCTFLFKNSPKIEKLIFDYFNGAARVEPVSFQSEFRRLKTMTMNLYRGRDG